MSSLNEDELLSGREGAFRSTGKNAYMAENDLEALRAWAGDSGHTYGSSTYVSASRALVRTSSMERNTAR